MNRVIKKLFEDKKKDDKESLCDVCQAPVSVSDKALNDKETVQLHDKPCVFHKRCFEEYLKLFLKYGAFDEQEIPCPASVNPEKPCNEIINEDDVLTGFTIDEFERLEDESYDPK